MKDLSLHILDIVENSVNAKATSITIRINEDPLKKKLKIMIEDNGEGMDKKQINQVLDPFYTTKKLKKIGLGIPLLAQAARETNGGLKIKSNKNRGARIFAKFNTNHIDMKPLGDITETIINIIVAYAEFLNFKFTHQVGANIFEIDTRDIKDQLRDISISNPEVICFLRDKINQGLKEIKTGRYIYEEAKNW